MGGCEVTRGYVAWDAGGSSTKHGTREEAVREASRDLKLKPGTKFFTGRLVLYKVMPFVQEVLDWLSNAAYDTTGGASGYWPSDLNEEQEAELNAKLLAAVNGFLDKHDLQPDFHHAIEVEEHVAKGRLE